MAQWPAARGGPGRAVEDSGRSGPACVVAEEANGAVDADAAGRLLCPSSRRRRPEVVAPA
jgi:hypothetical protein